MSGRALRFHATDRWGDVSALWLRPRGAHAAVSLGHGAGAGMQHRFMASVAELLAAEGVATFRYQFPYIERGSRYPDAQRILLETVRSAAAEAARRARGLTLLAGGKSMGGRMTSISAAAEPLRRVSGLVFLGFPLHAPGRPAGDRADHLSDVSVPMLFLQGTRDKLADLSLLRPVCEGLGPTASLHIVEDGDHSFHVPKRAGRPEQEVLGELARTISEFARGLG